MASPPFNLDISDPTDASLGNAFPANERAFRDNVSSYLGTEHDSNTGYHKFQLLSTAAKTALTAPPTGMLVFDTTQQLLQLNTGSSSTPTWTTVGGSSVLLLSTLTGNMNFYVNAASGLDSNNGLTSGTAWQTLNHAYSTIQSSYDLTSFTVTINLATGTYATLQASGPCIGQTLGTNQVVILGNPGSPSSCIIRGANGAVCTNGAQITFQGIQFQATGSGATGLGLVSSAGATAVIQNCDFNACVTAHMAANGGTISTFSSGAAYSVSANSPVHWSVGFSGAINTNSGGSGTTLTLVGTPAFSTAFALASSPSVIQCGSMTFSGTATGKRYSVSLNAVINTGTNANNTDNSYLPGNVAGTSASGGFYN